MSTEDGYQLVIYLNQDDLVGRKPAVDAVIREALRLEFHGASIFRAVEGFGSHRRIERGRLLSTEDDRGVMMVLIEKDYDKIAELMSWIGNQLPGTFATTSKHELHHLGT